MKLPAGEKHIIITVVALCAGLLLLLAFMFRKKLAIMIFDTYIVENKDAFVQKVKQISQNLGINPDWLMAVMAFESNLNHTAVNKKTNATGLIQFMPATAASLGTTVEALKAMSNVQQLSYVEKYLMPYKGKMNKFTDVYFAVFFPAAIGKSDNDVLQTSSLSASKIAEQNTIFDLNKDSKITVGEVKQSITNWVAKRGFTII